MIVEPSGFRTDFSGRSLHQSAQAIADYAGTAGLRRKENSNEHAKQAGDPVLAAKAIIEAVQANTQTWDCGFPPLGSRSHTLMHERT